MSNGIRYLKIFRFERDSAVAEKKDPELETVTDPMSETKQELPEPAVDEAKAATEAPSEAEAEAEAEAATPPETAPQPAPTETRRG
ncbi:MAG: hypothetical protein HW563_03665, partial [Ruegeria pomeroyi]|nr:hypothetical protein [Ruegeria pomeroyi]